MATMDVSIVSAERQLRSGQANAVYARSLDGEIGILPGHQPALLALAAAPVKVHGSDGQEILIAVHRGFLEFGDNQLTLLADTAELVEDIDVARAEAAKRRAERRIGGEEHEEAAAELARAELRLELARGR